MLIQDSSESNDSETQPHHPRYEIRQTRKFEPIEMCEIFLTKWGKYLYMVVWTLNCFLTGWSFTTVAASAWSTNIPFRGSNIEQCSGEDFLRVLIPEDDQCWHAYMICVLLFAAIVVPLSLIDLSEQALLHMVLGILRFLTIGMIILYAVVKLSLGTNECRFTLERNASLFLSRNVSDTYTLSSDNTSVLTTAFGFSDLSRIVFRFDVKGWLVSIPVITFALMLHQGIPTLTHPIREKHLLRQFMVSMYSIATISYLSLGVVVPLWFKANIQETCTLNWVRCMLLCVCVCVCVRVRVRVHVRVCIYQCIYHLHLHIGNGMCVCMCEIEILAHTRIQVPLLSDPDVHPAIRALSYYLVLFPSIDVISAYPLTIHAIANNIFMILGGRDTSRKSKHPTRDCILHYTIRFVCAVLPIVAALFISNLVYVLKYAGMTGFVICFLFPTALQLRSIWVCSREFESNPVTVEMKKIGKVPLLTEEGEGEEAGNSDDGTERKSLMCFLRSLKKRVLLMFSHYRTPYSSRVLSHPITVSLIGGVGVALTLLGVSSLGVHPDQIFCQDEP